MYIYTQGRIKVGATGVVVPGPPSQGRHCGAWTVQLFNYLRVLVMHRVEHCGGAGSSRLPAPTNSLPGHRLL